MNSLSQVVEQSKLELVEAYVDRFLGKLDQ